MTTKAKVRLPQNLDDLNQWETKLIEQFCSHPTFVKLRSPSTMPIGELHQLLLQRRFLSFAFTVVYDMAIDGITHQAAKETARAILREEYPGENGDQESHRELLVLDLIKLGLTRQEISRSTPSPQTIRGLSSMLQMLTQVEDDALYQIRLITILRFWGEVLVSEEYKQFWFRMEQEGLIKRGDPKKRSRFYYPHLVHDEREHNFGTTDIGDPRTHSDRLGNILEDMTTQLGYAGVEHCAKVEQAIVDMKYQFYNQFV